MLEARIRLRLGAFELDAEFHAEPGITALRGPSGAGKSLTLRAIAGVVRPDAGRIAFDGREFMDDARGTYLPPQLRGVGYVPQHYALFPHMTVEGNVGAGLFGLGAEERRERVRELIASMDLRGMERRRPGELSGGQKQRVALARALAPSPGLLLLDEPFAALDARIHAELRDRLAALREAASSEARPITILLVTHDREDVERIADREIGLEEGRVVRRAARP